MRVSVEIVEVDSFGPEVTEVKTFPNLKAATKFIKRFNEKHGIEGLPKKPEWYMLARVKEDE